MEAYADAVAAAHLSDKERAWRIRDLKRVSKQRKGQVITLKEEVDYDNAVAAAAKSVSRVATEFATTEIQYHEEDLGTVHASTLSVQVRTLTVSLPELQRRSAYMYRAHQPQPNLAAMVLTINVDTQGWDVRIDNRMRLARLLAKLRRCIGANKVGGIVCLVAPHSAFGASRALSLMTAVLLGMVVSSDVSCLTVQHPDVVPNCRLLNRQPCNGSTCNHRRRSPSTRADLFDSAWCSVAHPAW